MTTAIAAGACAASASVKSTSAAVWPVTQIG